MNSSPTVRQQNEPGSTWHRWDPHIHVPGTILNDGYTGVNPWEDFLTKIEQSNPSIRALGITDYYSLDCYEEVLKRKQSGRIPNVDLVFANVELRLTNGVPGRSAINLHLLVSPEDPSHVTQMRRFLRNLTFKPGTDTFRCEKSDLIRLGRFHAGEDISDEAALETGTNQFKVDFQALLPELTNNKWAKENLLLAVSGSSRDGTATLQDSSFGAIRKSIEKHSHIIFASQSAQRKFWLGQGAASEQELEAEYNGRKPCIHGSDAHRSEVVGNPSQDRYTWIKGDLTFESLRQIILEPEHRVIVDQQAPVLGIDSQVIVRFRADHTLWLQPATIPLNAGLVAIIGARGSGKTALADLIALGGHGIQHQISGTSFINRAKDHLEETVVSLDWRAGPSESKRVSDYQYDSYMYHERVQYLSQQFVERLCSSEGVTDELMREMERVIFTAHASEDKLGYEDFSSLLEAKAELPRRMKENAQYQIRESSSSYLLESAKKASLPQLRGELQTKQQVIQNDKASQQGLINQGQRTRMQEYTNVRTALDHVSNRLETAHRKEQALKILQQQVSAARMSTFTSYYNKLKAEHAGAALSEAEWQIFRVNFFGDVDTLLQQKLQQAQADILRVRGTEALATPPFPTSSFIPSDVQFASQSFTMLSNEEARLKHLIGVDTENGKKYTLLAAKIQKAERELAGIQATITDAEGADQRIANINDQRKAAYREVFEALLEEQHILEELYRPLQENLRQQSGSLGKLSFVVQRTADMKAWAEKGESLLDLRKNGPFRGKGELLRVAGPTLKTAWEQEDAAKIAEAHAKFLDDYRDSIMEHRPVEPTQKDEWRRWISTLLEWLYGTDHISISYGVQYDGVDIRQLSPGTRGIVLLLLYLAIDQEDVRPLIIDQPEENLDPKSIFDELVPLFRAAKLRRQIIIVTHNANLVVNTDADQVIVASSGVHRPGQLPILSYESGGLENPRIRRQVCGILEGGEEAFKERAKRLRVVLQ
jgi:energy-coupling factor transporter ATP-binding protein EcfA2